MDHQRDERLDRTKSARTASIEVALGDYEKALGAARSLWLASERWTSAERRKRFLGWASGQLRARDFLAAAMEAPTLRNPTGVELQDERVGTASLVASHPPGFRAEGRYTREDRRTIPGGDFALRYAPLPGDPVLTEQTFPAPLVLLIGIAAASCWGRCCGCWPRSGQPACVALPDLDHFKQYNDRQGHQAGDRFLKEAAAAGQAVVRRTDLVARYGGEEFAILLPDCHLDDAMEIAERLRTAQPEGTCSLGVAQWDGREDVTALVARADRALYAAKEAGRDRVRADRATTVETAAP